MKNFFVGTFTLCLFTLSANAAFALITVEDGKSFDYWLNDGAFITDNAAPSNTFYANDLINYQKNDDGQPQTNDGAANNSNEPFALGIVPYLTFEGIDYFQFIYDMQETGNGESLEIDQILFTGGVTYDFSKNSPAATGGSTVWELGDDYHILLNAVEDEDKFTNSPLGAGGDMALYVPVSLFLDMGLTTSSLMTMTVTQNFSDNGDDEWVVLGDGLFIVDSEPPVEPPVTPVPEPSTFLLLGGGLAGLALVVRRRKKE